MVKLVYCIRRRKDMPADAFYRYWLEEHAEKVRSVKDRIGARRYVQSHTCEAEINAALLASRGLAPAYDGITEVWWDSAEDLRAALADSDAQAAMASLVEDESRFIDFSESRVFMTTEHTIFE